MVENLVKVDMSVTKYVFGDYTEALLDFYIAYFNEIKKANSLDGTPEMDRILVELEIESSVRLGYLVAERKPSFYTEVGCGLGIPSLTLAKLGFDGAAFDINPNLINFGKRLARELRLFMRYTVVDADYWTPSVPDTFIIAEKPRHKNDETQDMEKRVLDIAIGGGYSLAMVPYLWDSERGDNLIFSRTVLYKSVVEKCRLYSSRLEQHGYKTHTFDMLPVTVGSLDVVFFQAVIAEKSKDVR